MNASSGSGPVAPRRRHAGLARVRRHHPERLIHMNTYVGDLVLDPFVGSGTTAVAAARTGRSYIGYDTD
ncbi:MAG: DNA methyltransferase, partial [Ilumatobacteraceae bacterium]